MKQIVKLILIVFSCLMAIDSYAQRVVVDNGKVIIDASGIEHTKTKKARGTTGTVDTAGGSSLDDISSLESNSKVYYRFEVSKEDNSSQRMPWRSAVDLCENLSTEGGGWRLPTQRELSLIWVLKSELLSVSGFNDFVKYYNYWCATVGYYEDTTLLGHYSWDGCITDGDGTFIGDIGAHIKLSIKTSNNYVRCIRDLD
ncbi:hypothetical protein [Parabacteroides sp.]